jgi:hypothetical protein
MLRFIVEINIPPYDPEIFEWILWGEPTHVGSGVDAWFEIDHGTALTYDQAQKEANLSKKHCELRQSADLNLN